MARVVTFLLALAPLVACGETYGSSPVGVVDSGAPDSGVGVQPVDDGAVGSGETEAGAPDANVGDGAPVCDSGKPNGETCNAHAECCSAQCNEAHLCGGKCGELTAMCDRSVETSCCVGLWCGGNLGTTCVPCVASGGEPAILIGIRIRESCCSRSIAISGKCH